jgi:hypothetical protein
MEIKYNQSAINGLAVKYGFSKRYVRECISGRRKCVTGDTIRKDYNEMLRKIDEAIK